MMPHFGRPGLRTYSYNLLRAPLDKEFRGSVALGRRACAQETFLFAIYCAQQKQMRESFCVGSRTQVRMPPPHRELLEAAVHFVYRACRSLTVCLVLAHLQPATLYISPTKAFPQAPELSHESPRSTLYTPIQTTGVRSSASRCPSPSATGQFVSDTACPKSPRGGFHDCVDGESSDVAGLPATMLFKKSEP